jgi:NAD(P)-dependent dehydrogenase (short-subunit alcohol dehydrogenase family)
LSQSLFDLSGRLAVVTGGSRGLGSYMALALARAGADLLVTSRKASDCDRTVADVAALGRKARALSLDVTSRESIEEFGRAVRREIPGVDILVNNAGCNVRKASVDVTWEDWDRVVGTNLKGSFFVSREIASGMIERKYGKIINIGSVTCVFGYAGIVPYSASRGGVLQMTRALASEWGPHGINVNCLAPGWFRTEQNKVLYDDPEWVSYLVERIPLGRPGQPDDLDGAVVFLASEASRYVHGQLLLVDGGITTGNTRAVPRR